MRATTTASGEGRTARELLAGPTIEASGHTLEVLWEAPGWGVDTWRGTRRVDSASGFPTRDAAVMYALTIAGELYSRAKR